MPKSLPMSVALRVARTCAMALLAVGAAAACSADQATPAVTPAVTPPVLTTTRTSTTATTTASIESPSLSATPAPTQAGVSFPESQQDYTSQLVRAWGVGDRTAAGHYATDGAVQRLFADIDPGGPGWALLGCDNAGPRPACTFADPGQGQRLVLFYDADRLGQPDAVVDVEFIADDPSADVQ